MEAENTWISEKNIIIVLHSDTVCAHAPQKLLSDVWIPLVKNALWEWWSHCMGHFSNPAEIALIPPLSISTLSPKHSNPPSPQPGNFITGDTHCDLTPHSIAGAVGVLPTSRLATEEYLSSLFTTSAGFRTPQPLPGPVCLSAGGGGWGASGWSGESVSVLCFVLRSGGWGCWVELEQENSVFAREDHLLWGYCV